jgi:transposase InsO family protein
LYLSRKRVARLMRQAQLRASRLRPRPRFFTRKGTQAPVAPNVLGQTFEVAEIDRAWACDITYIPTAEGWLYLAVVLDLCSRRLVGHAISTRMGCGLVMAALEMALGRRKPAVGVLHHSDQGSQYASSAYQQLLRRQGLRCSMSRRGNCWDNAPVESFFATLKRELAQELAGASQEQARHVLFAYLETYYNTKRRHSALGYRTPAQYERFLNEQRSKAA